MSLSSEALLAAQHGALIDAPGWPWVDDLVNDRLFGYGTVANQGGANGFASIALHNPPKSNKTYIVRAFFGVFISQNVFGISKGTALPPGDWSLDGHGFSLRADSTRQSGDLYVSANVGGLPPHSCLSVVPATAPIPILPLFGSIVPGTWMMIHAFVGAPAALYGGVIWKELAIRLPDL